MQNQREDPSADHVSFGTGKKYIMIACHPARVDRLLKAYIFSRHSPWNLQARWAGLALKLQTTPLVK
jgi:hypothetical protein